jgi:hypothetical protein
MTLVVRKGDSEVLCKKKITALVRNYDPITVINIASVAVITVNKEDIADGEILSPIFRRLSLHLLTWSISALNREFQFGVRIELRSIRF